MQVQLMSIAQDQTWDAVSSARPDWDDEQTLVLIFGAPQMREGFEPLDELLKSYKHAHILGCSSAGEIYEQEVRDLSLSVAITRFEHTKLRSCAVQRSDYTSTYEAGAALAYALADDDLKGIFVLSDGLAVNGTQLVAALNAHTGKSVTITGGLAADGPDFKHTWVVKDKALEAGWITAVGFYGDHVQIAHGSEGGWDAFGPLREVTKSEGNVLLELDGKPALELYERYLGDRASELPGAGLRFPLVLFDQLYTPTGLVRTILDIDRARSALIFAGDMPEGHYTQMMKANLDRLINGAHKASEEAHQRLKGQADEGEHRLLIATSCVGRRLVLGQRVEEEVEATMELARPHTKQIGFYSYGEICPRAEGPSDLHNQTMTLTLIHESMNVE